MSQPTREQKFTIGVYVGLLTLVVLGIWIYFFKFEIKSAPGKQDQQASTFSQLKDRFNQFLQENKNKFSLVASQLGDLIKNPATSTEEMAKLITKKAEEKLRTDRMAQWPSFSNSDFSLRYPDAWLIKVLKNSGSSGAPGQIEIVSSSTVGIDHKRLAEAKISITLSDNSKPTSTSAWLEGINKTLDKSCKISTSTDIIINSQAGAKEFVDSCSDAPNFHQEYYALPAGDKRMLEIKVETAAAAGIRYRTIFMDIIQSIIIK